MYSIRESTSKRVKFSTLAQSNLLDIPPDWLVKSLNEVARINPQAIDETYPHKEILYIDIGSVENFQVQRYERFRLDQRPDRAQRVVRKNDIIVSTVRPNLKAFAKIHLDDSNLVCSTGFAVIRPFYSEDVDFIFNYIRSHHFETNILRHMEGIAYPAITSKVVERSLIPYPPSRLERTKIASTLSKIDDLIQKTGEIIKQSQRLKKGLTQKLLTKGIEHTRFKKMKLGEIPEEWSVLQGKDACSEIVVGIVIKPASLYSKEGVPCLRSFNIREDEINEKDIVFISKESNELNSKSKLREGDVLIVRTGYPGTSCVVPKKFVGGNCIDLVIARPKKHLDSSYLSRFINSDVGKAQVLKSQAGLAQQHFNVAEVRNMLIPIPPHSEQLKIVTILSNISSQIKVNLDYKFELETLKKGLMQKLLTGKIRVKV